jgi:uncharacterized protein with ATP-grasp and redox domains
MLLLKILKNNIRYTIKKFTQMQVLDILGNAVDYAITSWLPEYFIQ